MSPPTASAQTGPGVPPSRPLAGDPEARRVVLQHLVLGALLVVPWVWPFTAGPSTAALPLLASWACLALALPFLPRQQPELGTLLARSWVLAALLSAGIGIAQRTGLLPDTPLLNASVAGEVYANLRQRNQFATLLGIGLAALVWLPGLAGRRGVVLAVALLAVANALSASRTGALQWLVLLLLASSWPGDRRRRMALCGLALGVYVATMAAMTLLPTAADGGAGRTALARAVEDMGCSSRRVLWSNVLHLVAQRPWAGWGWGELDYAHYATLYSGPRFCEILDNAHNLPLHLAVELGVPAAAVLVGLFALWVARARPWFERDPQRQLAWAVLLLVGVHSTVEYPLWYGPFQLAVLFALAMLLPESALARARRSAWPAAVALALAVGTLHQQYDRVSEAYRSPQDRRPAYRVDPVSAARASTFLFQPALDFAELSVQPLTRASAPRQHAMALQALHYSPEPLVIERVLDSALVLGRDDVVLWHAARYQAAFPAQYAAWLARMRSPPGGRGH